MVAKTCNKQKRPILQHEPTSFQMESATTPWTQHISIQNKQPTLETRRASQQLSLFQNIYHLLYTSKYGAAASSSSYPRNAEEAENLRAQQQHAEPRGLMGSVPKLLKNKKETPHYKKKNGEWMERPRMQRRRESL